MVSVKYSPRATYFEIDPQEMTSINKIMRDS